MRIEVSITKQHIVSLVLAVAIVAGISYAVAQAPNPGHTVGEIDFTGGFTVPSGDVVVSSGNVGIGTTSPGQKLDVNGYIKATGFCMESGEFESCRSDWPSPSIHSCYEEKTDTGVDSKVWSPPCDEGYVRVSGGCSTTRQDGSIYLISSRPVTLYGTTDDVWYCAFNANPDLVTNSAFTLCCKIS